MKTIAPEPAPTVESRATDTWIAGLLGSSEPTPADYLRASRAITLTDPRLRPLKVAVVSSVTAEILRPYLVVESARRGLAIDTYFGPYARIDEELLDPESRVYRWLPDVIVVADLSLVPSDRSIPGEVVEGDLERLASRTGERVHRVLQAVRSRTSAAVLVFNTAAQVPPAAPIAAQTGLHPINALGRRVNAEVARACEGIPDVFVFDYDRFVLEHGTSNLRDEKLAHMARMPLSVRGQVALATRLARSLRALVATPCKCLVLDLDGVLWGGILGDDGIGGIALGEDFPGNVYKGFQRYLLALRSQGILLAIASKNDRDLVERAFAAHGDMVLRLDHFSSVQVHWNDKASSLRAIARQLNIGLDALAFFDDSPFERELIRSQLPEVRIIDAPATSSEFIDAIEGSELFDRTTISSEDSRRAEMMEEERSRATLLSASGSFNEFLRGLRIRVRIGHVHGESLGRVAQLLAKTNQFNLTTRRHSAAVIEAKVRRGAIALWARVSDVMGDSGLTAVAIARAENGDQWLIDSFVMSCRVLGRGIETAVLAALLEEVRGRGGRTIVGEYIPTERNSQVAGLYPKHGFTPLAGRANAWALDLSRRIEIPEHLKLERE